MPVARQLRIFLNYRRDETSGHAGRLFDVLTARFGDDHVFMDIDRIEPGLDFADVISEAVASCDVFIALIGSRWLTSADAKGRPRLENPEDFVRLELEAALELDVRVIPALVQNAEMPSSDELPETLRPFARRHAVELSDTRWMFDIGKLIETLERLQTGLSVRQEAEQEKAEREAQERAEAEAQALAEREKAEREAQERAEAEAQALAEREKAEREAHERAEAEAQELTPAFDEASSPKVLPDTEPAREPEVAHPDARSKPTPVDRSGTARPSWAARLFARLDPRGEVSWPARLGRVIALTAALIAALVIFVFLAEKTRGWIVVPILVLLAVYAVRRRRRGQAT